VDFGKETFGYIRFARHERQRASEPVLWRIKEEALATASCETLDRIPVDNARPVTTTLKGSRAFRYVYIKAGGVNIDSGVDALRICSCGRTRQLSLFR